MDRLANFDVSSILDQGTMVTIVIILAVVSLVTFLGIEVRRDDAAHTDWGGLST